MKNKYNYKERGLISLPDLSLRCYKLINSSVLPLLCVLFAYHIL